MCTRLSFFPKGACGTCWRQRDVIAIVEACDWFVLYWQFALFWTGGITVFNFCSNAAGDSAGKIKAVVTGGCGCLGQEIVRQLIATNRYAVHCLDLFIPPEDKRIAGVDSYIQTDITYFNDVSRALQGMEVVFHTAALMPVGILSTPEAMERVNVNGTKSVIKACKETDVKRLIYTSSVYVTLSKDPKLNTEEMDESSPLPKDPLNAYARTKGKAELAVREANGENGLRTCALRLGGLLGGRNNKATENLMSSRVFKLGKGNFVIGWTTVKSAAEVHLLAERYLTEKPVSATTNVFNVISTNSSYADLVSSFSIQNTGKEPTEIPMRLLKTLVSLNEGFFCLTGLTPLGTEVNKGTIDSLVPNSHSTKRAEKELGWAEKRPLKQIVSDCIAEYKQF